MSNPRGSIVVDLDNGAFEFHKAGQCHAEKQLSKYPIAHDLVCGVDHMSPDAFLNFIMLSGLRLLDSATHIIIIDMSSS